MLGQQGEPPMHLPGADRAVSNYLNLLKHGMLAFAVHPACVQVGRQAAGDDCVPLGILAEKDNR